LTESAPTCNQLPEPLHSTVHALLLPGESLRAVFQPDLDDRLRFCEGLVLLTDRRLLSREAPGAEVRAWPLDQVERLQTRDRGGLAILVFVGGTDQAKDLFSLYEDTISRLLAGLKK